MQDPARLTRLQSLLATLVASPYSDFYRELYNVPAGSVPNLHTWDDWQLVPHFSKEAFLERPVREYTFVPQEKVEAIYYTSGTSGKLPAFISWLNYAGSYDYRRAFYNFQGAVLTSIKAQHRSDLFLADMGSNSLSVNFDGKHVRACVALAKAMGVDALGVHTFTVQALGEEMKRVGMNQNIKLIDFVGETCSLMLYSYMRETFPNAKIISFYSMTEAEGIVAKPCRELSDEEAYTIVHVNDGFHIDLIDPATGNAVEPVAGVEAEVLITDLGSIERGFPLVRYRPGDTVRVVDTKCKEHGTWTFTVLGKTASDFMLVPGGQLRADEIERVLRLMPQDVSDYFEMHRYDTGTKERPMLMVELKVQPTHEIDLVALAAKIAKELRVAPGRTYQDGVAEGRYVPLVCTVLTENLGERKHKRMFKH